MKKINLTIVLSLFLFTAPFLVFSANISSTDRYALFMESGSRLNLYPTGYGIEVNSSALTGYAWGENTGWVNFAPSQAGVLNDGNGVLSGYAWGENTGWINFAPTQGGVSILSNGEFYGYAWSENFGWIQFDCSVVNACVSTTWRKASGTSSGSSGTGGGTTTTPPTSVEPPIVPPTETIPPDDTSPTDPPRDTDPTEPSTTPPCTHEDCAESPTSPEIPSAVPPSAITSFEHTYPSTSSTTPIAETIHTIEETLSNAVEIVVGAVAGAYESVKDVTIEFVQSEKYDEIQNYVFAGSVGTLVLPGFLSFINIILTPGRFSSLFVSLLGWRRKKKPWGVVYDSVTKRPIDPAYVVLHNAQGEEISTSITDLDGRYGFLSEKGTYRIVANKTNYVFPSEKLRGKNTDEVYDNLYFGEPFEIDSEKTLVFKNIPMDSITFDWNEFEKKKTAMSQYYARWDRVISILLESIVIIGFSLAILASLIEPTVFNMTLVGLYIIIFVLKNTIFKWRQFGVITKDKKPLAYAVVRIVSEGGNLIAKKVTDVHGRYFALVRKGVYIVYIDQQRPGGKFETMYTSAPLRVRHGSIHKNFSL